LLYKVLVFRNACCKNYLRGASAKSAMREHGAFDRLAGPQVNTIAYISALYNIAKHDDVSHYLADTK
jgi:hypothetical protein